MLKHTVSAGGRVMPADRRTVLRSMLTVGAIDGPFRRGRRGQAAESIRDLLASCDNHESRG
jgi:hypothetical protein